MVLTLDVTENIFMTVKSRAHKPELATVNHLLLLSELCNVQLQVRDSSDRCDKGPERFDLIFGVVGWTVPERERCGAHHEHCFEPRRRQERRAAVLPG